MSTIRQATWSRPGYNTSDQYTSRGDGGTGSGLGSTVAGMLMLPWNMLVSSMRAMTDATVGMGQAATQSMSSMTGSGQSSQSGQASGQRNWMGGSSAGSSGSSIFGGSGSGSTGSGTGGGLTGTVNQMLVDTDLSGDDLKYVTYCIVSTKPGFEAVLKPQCDELVNYSTDGSTYGALKIARCLDDIRQGKVERPEGWGSDTHDHTATGSAKVSTAQQGAHTSQTQTTQSTWRIEPHDEKYLQVILKVERRLPKRTEYREEVTVRTTTNTSSIS